MAASGVTEEASEAVAPQATQEEEPKELLMSHASRRKPESLSATVLRTDVRKLWASVNKTTSRDKASQLSRLNGNEFEEDLFTSAK